MTTTATITYPTGDPLISEGKKIWPESMRGFPAMLVQAGIFTADSSNKNDLISPKSISVTSKTVESTVSEHISRYQPLDTQMPVFNGALRMRTFRVLLELFNEAKRSNLNDAIEISPQKLISALGVTTSGTVYSDIEQCIYELTFSQFVINSECGSNETTSSKLSSFITFFDSGKTVFINENGSAKVINLSCRRFSRWTFKLGYLSDVLLNNTPLARISPLIWREIGRSPLKLWLYSFYSTHGGDAKNIFDYRIGTLLETAGIKNSIEWLKQQKADDQDISTRRTIQNQYFRKALREYVYRVKSAVNWLSKFGIFEQFKVTDKEGSPLSSQDLLVRAKRYENDSETEYWGMNALKRITTLGLEPPPFLI